MTGFICENSASEKDRQERIIKMYREYKQSSFPNVADISIDEIAKMNRDSLIFLDVREKKEVNVSKIPHAITMNEFYKNKDLYRNKKIIVYCTIGYRSGIETKKLQNLKFNAFNLVGGILSWADAGRFFESTNNDSFKVHVYGEKWNILPPTYKGVW